MMRSQSRKLLQLTLLGFAALLTWSGGVRAHESGHQHRESVRAHRDVVRARHAFFEHEFHRFGPPESARWRRGAWSHRCFGGRCGWWWFAGGQWYFYDRPVYPYPLIVSGFALVDPMPLMPPSVSVRAYVPMPLAAPGPYRP